MKGRAKVKGKRQRLVSGWGIWWEEKKQQLRGWWWFHLGVLALWRGHYQKAAQWLEKALALLGENAFIRMQLMWAHWYLGHPVTASFHALRATEQMPHHAPAWVFAGRLLSLRGKWREAERAFRQALVLSPDNFVASSWLALVLFQTHREEEALQLLRRLPVMDEPYLQARLVLHLERLVSERGERDELPLSPPPRWAQVFGIRAFLGPLCRWRGERLLEDGNLEGAARWLHWAHCLRPHDLLALILLAVALIEGGRLCQAESIVAQLLPETPERRLLLALLWARQRRPLKALAALERCDLQHPLVRYYTALSWHWLGETERACASYLEPLYREDPSFLRVRLEGLLRWLSEFSEPNTPTHPPAH